MDRFITKTQLNCQKLMDYKPPVTYKQTLDTIGCVSGGALATCTYKSYKSKEIHNVIEKYTYAEEIRRDVQAKKMEKLRAERILRDIGVSPSFLEPLTTKPRISGSKFASISSNWILHPKKESKAVSYIGVPSHPNTGSYILKDDPVKVGLAALAGVVIYFLFMKLVKAFVKFIGHRPSNFRCTRK